jgi:hypothetical protein
MFPATYLRKYCALLHDQVQELTQLRQQLQEGREASLCLSQHLKDLLTQKDPAFYHGQGCREQLDEGQRLVEHLVCKISTGEVTIGPDYPELLQGFQLMEHSTSPPVIFL